MARWISAELRQVVADRAKQFCEYCLIAEADTFYGCEVDHIISLKHGGSTEPDNLAYACALCNRAKGSDVGSIANSGDFTRSSIRGRIVGRPLLFRRSNDSAGDPDRRGHRSHSQL